MDEHEAADRFDLERALAIARRRWWLVALCAIAVACAAFVFSAAQQKQYTATASLLLRDQGLEQTLLPTAVYSQTVDPTREAETNIDLVSSGAVTARVAKALHTAPATVANEITVSANGATNLVSVKAANPDPRLAAILANTYAARAISFRRETDQAQVIQTQRDVQNQLDAMTPAQRTSAGGQLLESRSEALKVLAAAETGNIQMVQSAGIPSAPSTPSTKRNVALGLLFGLLLGLGAAVLAERLDRRVREPEELGDIYGLPVLAQIPRIRALSGRGDALGLHVNERDAFRMLLARLRHTRFDSRVPSVVVTSASAQEGKSTVAWHLAETAAMAGRRVLLVEADMRAPVLAARQGLRAAPGLADVLASRRRRVTNPIQRVPIDADDDCPAPSTDRRTIRVAGTSKNGNSRQDPVATAGRHVDHHLSQRLGTGRFRMDVMVGGTPARDPTSLIESERMAQLVLKLGHDYDFVVFDSGPALLVPDAISLMTMVGGVLVVGRIGFTSRDQAAMFRDQLRDLNVPTLGLIVNAAQAVSRRRYRRYLESPVIGTVAQPSRQAQPSSEHDHAGATSG